MLQSCASHLQARHCILFLVATTFSDLRVSRTDLKMIEIETLSGPVLWDKKKFTSWLDRLGADALVDRDSKEAVICFSALRNGHRYSTRSFAGQE